MSPAEVEQAIRAGIGALQARDAPAARDLFDRVTTAAPGKSAHWFLLAQACRMVGDDPAENAALDRVLADEPRHPGALIMKGDAATRAGDTRGATAFYQNALRAAGEAESVPPNLAAQLKRVEGVVIDAARQYRDHLDAQLTAGGFPEGARGNRIEQALGILYGERQVYLQEPTSFYFPGLPQRQFYEREEFPWLDAIEAAIPEMRAELLRVMEDDTAFAPYVAAVVPGRPNRAHSLLDDPDWSASYLWKDGAPVAANADRCPATMAALALAPIPKIAGRSPMALFSKLEPGTHIEPHNGMLNTRLICHVPLITPGNCRLRVGNEMREWEESKALIFDDSIEHEAWNDSEETRVVLLFEIWRPELTEDERRAMTSIYEAIGAFDA